MNFKLHNKYEIITKDQTIVAYNTILRTMYDKIKNLEQYTSHIAVGNGTNEIDFSGTNLSSYVASFETVTEDICADPSKNTLFVKKLVSFDENDQTEFSFCELGLCASSDTDPEIYNHVLLKDDNGNVVTITKSAGDILQIRITIYLELENLSNIGFYKGENALIKQFLGEDLGNSDHKIYAVRGEFLADNNENVFRPVPTITDNTKHCSLVLSESADGKISLKISAKLGVGETEEIVFVYAGQVVLRANLLNSETPIIKTETLSATSDNVLELGKNVKEIQSLSKDSASILETAHIEKYGTKITDKCTTVFDQTFSSSDKRFVSYDQNYIAFIKNGTTYLYHYENCAFKQVNVALPTNILDMAIFTDKIVCVLNASPYIQIYEKTNDTFSLRQTSLSNFNLSSFSYSWQSAKTIITSTGKILVGIIENNTNHTPFALSFTKNGDGIYVDEIVRLTFDCSNFIVPIYGSSYCENMLLFFTITYQGEDLYGIEKVDQSGHALVSSSEQAFAILDENVKEFSGGRMIVSNKGSAKAIKVLYLGDYEIGQDNLLYADNIWLSKNGNYLIQKLNGAFKIYNCHRKNTFMEFEEGYLNLINQETATDFEFIGDKIIVFTNSETEPIYSVTIKKNMTRVDNISGDNISATYLQYNPLGSNSEQGVMTTLTLSFNDDEETTSASNNGE